MRDRVICIDFDGTIVKHAFPKIGEPLEGAFSTMKELKAAGYRLILWTCRENEGDIIYKQYLTDAVKFCEQNGVVFDAVNESIKECEFRPETTLNRKPYADYYIDDRNVGGFPGWDFIRRVIMLKHTASFRAAPIDQKEALALNVGLGETRKAYARRAAEGWFDKYAPADKPGIDIGCQFDALNETFRRWDVIFGDGDATYMEGVPDNSFFTVYASHILEHLDKPVTALQNWFRILQPGGHMIVMVPHRDLYEKKKILPSSWNIEHKLFYLPDQSELPSTVSLLDMLEHALPNKVELVSLKTLNEGYDYSLPPHVHSVGEISIEAILKKN